MSRAPASARATGAADFEAFGAEVPRAHRMDPAVVERWRGFVTGEGLVAPSADAEAVSV